MEHWPAGTKPAILSLIFICMEEEKPGISVGPRPLAKVNQWEPSLLQTSVTCYMSGVPCFLSVYFLGLADALGCFALCINVNLGM